MPKTLDLDTLAPQLEEEGAEATVRWGLETFHPQIVLACSFGLEDVCLVDMAVRQRPDARIFYLDTDLLFEETYRTRDRLEETFGIEFIRVGASLSLERQAAQEGPDLWRRNPSLCCEIRKVVPLKGFLKGEEAWITGIRREQSPTRKNARVVEEDRHMGLIKLNPLAAWTLEDVWSYVRAHDVPYNPLHDHGYPSIGCVPCTRPVRPGEDIRAGRWSGFDKKECGIHVEEA